MPDSLLHKVARAGWNDTDPLSLAKAREVLRVVHADIAQMGSGAWVLRGEVLARILEDSW